MSHVDVCPGQFNFHSLELGKGAGGIHAKFGSISNVAPIK